MVKVSEILEKWYAENKRDLPWRRKNTPYLIWLSEIILQQTRVSQGLKYYLSFVEKFPSVVELADAPIEEVLKLWQGLGYYTRARHLHETARKIVSDYHGRFPEEYEELLKLKGIGPYSAAAIASIAFRKPVAVVDGNVLRVVSRLYGIGAPIDLPAGKKIISEKALEILNCTNPGMHNQALMEFGALLCKPKNPLCKACPFMSQCRAYIEGKTGTLPVRSGKIKLRERFFDYLFIQHDGCTYLKQRTDNDIWNMLYEFPLIESSSPPDEESLVSSPGWKVIFGGRQVNPDPYPRFYKHQLTHQILHCRFHRIKIDHELCVPGFNLVKVTLAEVRRYAVPRVIDRYLSDLRHERLL